MKKWVDSGHPWIWLNAGAVSIALVAVFGLLFLILVRGMSHFWPANVEEFHYQNAQHSLTVIAEIIESETIPINTLPNMENQHGNITRYLVKTGNRDLLGNDFRWLYELDLIERSLPKEIIVLERIEWGNLYGYLEAIYENNTIISNSDNIWDELEIRLSRTQNLRDEILGLEKDEIGAINYQLERLRLKQKSLQLNNKLTKNNVNKITNTRKKLKLKYNELLKKTKVLYQQIKRDKIEVKVMDGSVVTVPFEKIVKAWQPNKLNIFEKIVFYMGSIRSFIMEDPREANTEGGVFPAIFGTVLMVLLMAIMVTPLGVIAAVYLREYAKQGLLTRVIRITVNNLAGVPSIVYGVFGLGFFVYFIGGNIDDLFFPETKPSPTFGTPGLLWSSLTLALLTLPVVIVATEEGLSRIPTSLREGSLGLGATKVETLIMTGLILAIARAAGEVAPLMLVGVVKLAPSLPIDGNFPYLHLDRQFMHLGFHIYDVGFHLLVLVIVGLNLTAINMRNKLREKYRGLDS